MLRSIGAVLSAAVVAALISRPAPAAPIVFSAVDSILSEVDDFRAALGDPLNGNAPGPLPSGRREINWDGGGSSATSPAPNPFAGFQVSRGALFTTDGTGFVQAPPSGMGDTFGNPTYSAFPVFSPLRLFSPVGSNTTDTTFTVPGFPSVPAFVRGFGVVFSDVDTAGAATLEFFDLNGDSLGEFSAPAFDGGLSFLGVVFDAEAVGRVRITSGSVAPGPDDGPNSDIVLMDDFLYSEPQAVPEPSSLLLLGAGLAGILVKRRRG
jgi:hypothetical protein